MLTDISDELTGSNISASSFEMVVNIYSGHKITESLGNVTVTGEKRWKE
jgi:hypothetical protein